MNMRLIGFVPSPTPTAAFATPLYRSTDDASTYYFHKLGEKSATIQSFAEASKDRPVHMVDLHETFQKNVEIGSPAMFVVCSLAPTLLFVGTGDELIPFLRAMDPSKNKHFLGEALTLGMARNDSTV